MCEGESGNGGDSEGGDGNCVRVSLVVVVVMVASVVVVEEGVCDLSIPVKVPSLSGSSLPICVVCVNLCNTSDHVMCVNLLTHQICDVC